VNKSEALWQTLRRHRLIALLTPDDPRQCIDAYEVLQPLGVVLEIALRGRHGLPGIEALLREHPDALVLAGTVLTRSQAEQVLAAGVAGVVSADYVPAVVEECVAADVMCIPGGLTDCGKQLVHKSELYGYTLDQLRERRPWQWIYKLFPAMADEQAVLGTAQAWRAVYPDVQLVYTGGVTLENVGRLARQDTEGIFCGSALARHCDDRDRMRQTTALWLAAVAAGGGGAARSSGMVPVTQTTGSDAGAEESSTGMVESGTNRVVTFGEIMLRLSSPMGYRLRQATSFDVTYGGAEANVAVALAQWGLASRYVTALPKNDLGQAAVDRLRSLGVDTSHVRRRGDRIGVYYLEHGASQRSSRVIYDRAASAAACLRAGEVDWDEVFADAVWFHWTGITPGLSEGTAAATAEAVSAARRHDLTVSVDLNYRAKLWSRESAREVMIPLVEQSDIVVANEEDAADVFGIVAGMTKVDRGELDYAAYEDVARQLVDRFELRMAAITLRQSHSASENSWSACLWDGAEFLTSKSYRIRLVDRVGAGDAFSAGLIHGLLSGKTRSEALEFGVAASCLKQTILGDFDLVTVDEVQELAGGDVAGRIKR